MANQKLIKGVAYNIADHGLSSLSWLNPDLGKIARQRGLDSICVDLIEDTPSQSFLLPMKDRVAAYRKKFSDMVSATGNSIADVELAFVVFYDFGEDDYPLSAESCIELASGDKFRRVVSYVDNDLEEPDTDTLGPNWLP